MYIFGIGGACWGLGILSSVFLKSRLQLKAVGLPVCSLRGEVEGKKKALRGNHTLGLVLNVFLIFVKIMLVNAALMFVLVDLSMLPFKQAQTVLSHKHTVSQIENVNAYAI